MELTKRLQEAIARECKTDTGKELATSLKGLYDNTEFIGGVLAFVKDENQRKELIKLIKNGVTRADVINFIPNDAT